MAQIFVKYINFEQNQRHELGTKNLSKLFLNRKEGCRFSMEGTLLATLLCSLQRYYPNITIIGDGQICMFAVLLRFTLSFVYKVYIGFLSRMRDWTVAVNLFIKVQYL
jgi:hypothetical protein